MGAPSVTKADLIRSLINGKTRPIRSPRLFPKELLVVPPPFDPKRRWSTDLDGDSTKLQRYPWSQDATGPGRRWKTYSASSPLSFDPGSSYLCEETLMG